MVFIFCDLVNGSGCVFALGGTTDFRFIWEGPSSREGATQQDILGGLYLVRVEDANGCFDTLSVRIPEIPPAQPFITTNPPSDTAILLSQANLQFHNETIGGVSYVWDFGVAGGVTDEENPSFQFTETGSYFVTLTAYKSYFVCPVDYTALIEVIPDGALFIPNAFTPNGDNANERFVLGGEGIRQLRCIIFDRWGREIMTFESIEDGWDGTDRGGNTAPEGVYTYLVQALLNNGEQVERAGTVTLIR